MTWRDVTLCPYSEGPLLPGTTGYHRVQPCTTEWMISKPSPAPPSISSGLQKSYCDVSILCKYLRIELRLL
eukprot:724956-Amorphochlora_amoeboformis.AAC.1